jgi:hypothetical protein
MIMICSIMIIQMIIQKSLARYEWNVHQRSGTGVQMSGADLTRVHIAQVSEAAATMNKRRVAVVADSEEGLTSLAEWTAANCSRPDDIEFKLLVRKHLTALPALPASEPHSFFRSLFPSL